MYAKTAKAERIPSTGGKARIYPNGYVYWITKSEWDKTLKRTVDDRVCIGKKVEEKDGWLYPNERFFRLFNESIELIADGTGKLASRGKFSTVLNFGVFEALLQAASKCGCLEALKTSHPNDYEKILAVAIHSIDAQNSVAQEFPDWAFHNYNGLKRIFGDGEISTLYTNIAEDSCAIETFLDNFRKNFKQKFNRERLGILGFDSTNQNTASKNISLAEFGHAKINENLPDINTAMFVDEDTGIPLFYEHFYGSLLDKSETPTTLEKVKELGFEHLFLMMDRGYLSKECLKALETEKFGVMCPDGLTFTKELINKNKDIIKDNENYYIEEEDIYGIYLPKTEYDGKIYDAYVFYDEPRSHDERRSIHHRIEFFKKSLLKKKRFPKKLSEMFAPWIEVKELSEKDANGRNFSIKENRKEIQKYIDESGFFVILSNAGLSADQMIRVARMRDKSEKAFRRLKYHFGLTKTYVHNQSTYEGKMFVAFVALIIVEAFRYFVRSILRATSSETTATVISELRKYQIKAKNNGQWMPMYCMTASQKKIFTSLELTAAQVETDVRKLTLRV